MENIEILDLKRTEIFFWARDGENTVFSYLTLKLKYSIYYCISIIYSRTICRHVYVATQIWTTGFTLHG